MLDDAVAAFLESVSERALDEPLLALLRAQGFEHVHLTHGQEEFGKDIAAQKDGEQWVFQSKTGNVGQPQWRGLTGQLDELRLSNYAGPEFDPMLSRRAVLVLTGRMVGNAPLLATEYNQRAIARSEPVLEIWGQDHLLGALSSNPDAILRGSIDGALLTILGAIDRNDCSMDQVEHFSRRWDAFPPDALLGLGIIEAALVCERLRAGERLDLACHLALSLVRASWAGSRSEDVAAIAADAAGALFESYAKKLWAECDERLIRKRGLVGYSGFSAWATYSIRCVRIIEMLGLLGLRVQTSDTDLSHQIVRWIAKFVRAQPGVAHPIGDRYAVSLIPAALLLASFEPRTARDLIKRTAIWICDRHERWSFGAAPAGATPLAEIERVFGYQFEHVPLRKRRMSQTAGVLLDLAASLRYQRLYADIHNDVLAVRISPLVLRCPDTADQYALTGVDNRWEINPAYPERLLKASTMPAHLDEDAQSRQLVRLGRPWDLLAVSSALRDRHFVPAICAMVGRPPRNS